MNGDQVCKLIQQKCRYYICHRTAFPMPTASKKPVKMFSFTHDLLTEHIRMSKITYFAFKPNLNICFPLHMQSPLICILKSQFLFYSSGRLQDLNLRRIIKWKKEKEKKTTSLTSTLHAMSS